MASAYSVFRLNPLAPEFIPSSYTTGVISTSSEAESRYTLYLQTLPPPNNTSSSYYFPTHQTPPPPPPPPLSEPHPYYYNFYHTYDPFLLTYPQTHTPAPTSVPNFPVTGERVVDWKNSRRNWRNNKGREVVLGNYANKNDHRNKQACNGSTSTSTSARLSSGDGRGNEKFERVVQYGLTGKKGQRFDVVPLPSDGSITTVMIRNIPSKYSRTMLLHFIDQHCLNENEKVKSKINYSAGLSESQVWSAIDFFYMPMDFKTGWNKSYAFVNFTDPRAVIKFYNAFHNQKWELFHSNKIRQIVSAKIQGKKALVEHFGHTAFACESDEYLPVCFSPPRDGSNNYLADQSSKVVGKRIPIPN